MNSASLRSFGRLASKRFFINLFFPILIVSTAQLCWADSAPVIEANSSRSDAIASTLDKANLGDYAEIQVPEGYRFIDAEAARIVLDRMNNPVAPGLLGVLAPQTGKWWAVLEFDDIGYVKDMDQNPDLGAILKAVRDRNDTENQRQFRQGASRVASVEWEIEPKYDAAAHSLEWAFRADAQSGKVVNHSVALFGRRGVLQITSVQPIQSSQGETASAPLGELVKKITFKQGQRYSDYQNGDKLATAGLKELVLGPDPSTVAAHDLVSANAVPGAVMWIYSVLGGCVAIIVGWLVYRTFKKRKVRPGAAINGHAVASGQRNGKRNGQRKMFNYDKFYSDMVLQLSGHTYAWSGPVNGNSHARVAEAPPSAPQPAPTQAVANANSELIACQKNLIEEQMNLMREQTRIIEEKAKLIKEYNQLMEKWSDDIGSQFSLKLD